uniref:Transcription initiation factor TFIID subunit 9B n=2 Tax=Ascaris suum TaxID=6253 RepID=F1LEF7_ASCSU
MSAIPHDALVVQNVLKEMGVTDYEPRVVSQLLEFAYRYTIDLLEDARSVSEHAGKKQIDETDVQFAIDNAASAWRGARPDRQFMLELAEQKNSIPLPAIRQNFGMRLPNDRFCLVQPNMQWKSRERLRELAEQMSRNQKEEAERSTETPRQTRPEAITSVLKRRPIDEEDYDT